MPGNPIELTDADFSEKTAEGVLLVDFYGAWCPPCRLLEPELARLADAYAGRARIARIDVDSHSAAAVDCQVEEIPTLVFFKDGAERARLFGAHPFETLARELDKLLA
ncbi:MAG: thioredoxin fold domain-containing protein [Planctomycetota bacterium]|jgi:thioredoxin 1|nr:thioredoxin fold domain-containing protein [Planctomycetota bacterium]